jgi:hypothetical protein
VDGRLGGGAHRACRLGDVGGEAQPARGGGALEQLGQAGLEEGGAARGQLLDLDLVEVDADDVVTEVGHAGGVHRAEVAAADHVIRMRSSLGCACGPPSYCRVMRFGLFVPQGWRLDLVGIDPAKQWESMLGVARLAEDLSFESVWVYDHFHTVPVPTRRPPTRPGP